MIDYNEQMTQFRRLAILDFIANCPANISGDPIYTTNEYDLKKQLNANRFVVSTDALRTDLQWLAEQDLVYLPPKSTVWMVTLTARGDDVRQGLAVVHGVAQPQSR